MPEALINDAVAPVKPEPVITKVKFPVPSPDTAFVGDTLDTVGKFKKFVCVIFLRAPAEIS